MPTKLKPRSKVRLLVGFGNEPGALEEGLIGTVREIVPAAVIGAHNDSEDAVVVEFPQDGAGPRAVAFGVNHVAEFLEQIS